jgi:hypothetical protein
MPIYIASNLCASTSPSIEPCSIKFSLDRLPHLRSQAQEVNDHAPMTCDMKASATAMW